MQSNFKPINAAVNQVASLEVALAHDRMADKEQVHLLHSLFESENAEVAKFRFMLAPKLVQSSPKQGDEDDEPLANNEKTASLEHFEHPTSGVKGLRRCGRIVFFGSCVARAQRLFHATLLTANPPTPPVFNEKHKGIMAHLAGDVFFKGFVRVSNSTHVFNLYFTLWPGPLGVMMVSLLAVMLKMGHDALVHLTLVPLIEGEVWTHALFEKRFVRLIRS